ncbi:MAG: hypothetical protein KF724_13655 [Phycisphaeraceae bacterium]|nr:hypothetical protein [Phycisphaeraceae bacterium]
MVSGLDEERTYAYTASWQLLEERVDADYSGDPGLDKRVQYAWGLRYIDDCLMHRADLNNDGDYTDSNENTWYHMTDGMFSTVAVLNRTATLVERVSYDSYGQARHHRPGDVNGDGNSGFTDSAIVGTIIVANGGTPVPITSSLYRAEADLNRDGTINSSDRTLAGVSASALAAALISNAGTGGPDNSIGWDGYVFNPATGEYLVRHRTYGPTLGRWLERDPIGVRVETAPRLGVRPSVQYHDGMNVYQYVQSSPVVRLDPVGLVSAPNHGIDPNHCKEVYEACMKAVQRQHALCKHILDICDEVNFLEWYRRQRDDMDWLTGLPTCPCTLAQAKGETHPTRREKWRDSPLTGPRYLGEEFGTANSWSCSGGRIVRRYHPGASECCRSTTTNRHRAAQQCCYDGQGKLITSGGGAGTPDRAPAQFPGWYTDHWDWDVAPFRLAEDLDRKHGGSDHRRKYCEVRPPNNGRNCAPNPTPWPNL